MSMKHTGAGQHQSRKEGRILLSEFTAWVFFSSFLLPRVFEESASVLIVWVVSAEALAVHVERSP